MQRARQECEGPLIDTYKWILGKKGLSNLAFPGEQIPANTELTFDFVHPRSLLVGTADYVIDKIHELREVLGLQHLVIWSSHFGLPHKSTMRSLELFAERVIPVFSKDEPADKRQTAS
jgi:alkanesulfonate monooxygenase SsuD/methylene tetrahydromethanopterin reductase-like flavin-dependent oxidoreductase (luciferase family)